MVAILYVLSSAFADSGAEIKGFQPDESTAPYHASSAVGAGFGTF
jgi:hypothetical protein